MTPRIVATLLAFLIVALLLVLLFDLGRRGEVIADRA